MKTLNMSTCTRTFHQSPLMDQNEQTICREAKNSLSIVTCIYSKIMHYEYCVYYYNLSIRPLRALKSIALDSVDIPVPFSQEPTLSSEYTNVKNNDY